MDQAEPESVELFATLSKTDPWRLQRHYFPSKLGGIPAWLDPVNLPRESELRCDECCSIMTFVLQVYAPDDLYEENDSFHRTLFLFVCQPCGTRWKAFRSQLARKNAFYDFDPLEERITMPDPELPRRCCLACGLPSEGPASEPVPELGSVKIRLMDTEELRELHERCKIAVKHQTLAATLDEWILNICEGKIPVTQSFLSHEMQLYHKYLEEKKAKGDTMDESEEQAFDSIQEENRTLDRSFLRFSKKTTPNEVLYYSREGQPLWISDNTPRPVIEPGEGGLDGDPGDHQTNGSNHTVPQDPGRPTVPPCENCGGPRSFEFQLLPQLLHYLKSDRIDFGSVSVYTCSKSCKIENRYQREVVIVEKDYSMLPKVRNK